MKSITQDLSFSGSSKNIRQRLWVHRAELRHNKHENAHLQSAWNKYGEQNFDYYILEACEEKELLKREQWYITTTKPKYNMNRKTQRPPCSKISRRKQSETRKRLFKEGKLKPHFKHIPTYVYDLEGNFLKEYSSMKDAALGEFGVNTGAVRSACYGIQNPSHRVRNRRFYFEKLATLPKVKKKPNNVPHIIVHVDSDDEHLEFLGWKSAAEYFNTSVSSITQYCNKNIKLKRKYMVTTNTAV